MLTDAQVLAAQCDGVVLVLRADASTRQDSIHACDALTAVGAHILGVVINAVPYRRKRYHYRYSHSYNRYCRPNEGLLEGRSETHNKKRGVPLEMVFENRATVGSGAREWSQE